MIGADILARSLHAAGTGILFNLSGNQVMPLYSPLVDAGIRLVHTRTEAAAVHMADGYARLTERPCPVLVTAGPGHLNALGAIYVAKMAESPVVLLSGHAELTNLGRGAFQEIDQTGLARRVAKAAWVVREPARLGEELARAYRLATAGVPGPVCLGLPADVLRAVVPGCAPPPARRFARRAPAARGPAVDALLDAFRHARRPLLLTGAASARGSRWESVRRAAAAIGAPALPMESSRGANDPALGAARTIFARADLVVLVDRPADFALGFGRPPLFARGVRFLPTDIATLAAAGARAPAPERRTWCDEVAAAVSAGREDWPTVEASEATPMHPLRLVAAVRALIRPGDVVVSDGGEFGQWAQAGIARLDPRPELVVNGPSGAIGAALPFAIGAKLARPDARVFAFQGDGACGYHVAELDTAVRHGVELLLVVGDDGRWNAEVQIQKSLGGPPLDALGIPGVRYDRVAAAFGAHGERVTRPSELDGAFARALATGRPALVDAEIEPVPAPAFGAGH